MTQMKASDRTTWREIMAEIVRRITDGPWGPGTLLPGEVEMARTFGCSRTTMNRALRAVADQGYLDRRRKTGTRVRLSPRRLARFEIPMVRDEIEASGAPYRYALVQREVAVAPKWVRARMGVEADARMMHLVCVHHAGDRPFQMEDRWINAGALPLVLEQSFAVVTPNEWLIATVPFSQVEISFLACAADAAAAEHLGHVAGEPVFTVESATWWQDQAITLVSLFYHKGYRMTTRY